MNKHESLVHNTATSETENSSDAPIINDAALARGSGDIMRDGSVIWTEGVLHTWRVHCRDNELLKDCRVEFHFFIDTWNAVTGAFTTNVNPAGVAHVLPSHICRDYQTRGSLMSPIFNIERGELTDASFEPVLGEIVGTFTLARMAIRYVTGCSEMFTVVTGTLSRNPGHRPSRAWKITS